MDAKEIVKLTPEAVDEMLASSGLSVEKEDAGSKRRTRRWPFAGTVEVWLPASAYGERYFHATLHNLSRGGLAMRAQRAIHSGTRIQIAIHQPDLSACGDAIVRHCTRNPGGYLIGVEFAFAPEPDA